MSKKILKTASLKTLQFFFLLCKLEGGENCGQVLAIRTPEDVANNEEYCYWEGFEGEVIGFYYIFEK